MPTDGAPAVCPVTFSNLEIRDEQGGKDPGFLDAASRGGRLGSGGGGARK